MLSVCYGNLFENEFLKHLPKDKMQTIMFMMGRSLDGLDRKGILVI